MNNIIIHQNDSLIFFNKNCVSISHMFVALFPYVCLPFFPLTKKQQPTNQTNLQPSRRDQEVIAREVSDRPNGGLGGLEPRGGRLGGPLFTRGWNPEVIFVGCCCFF